MKNLSRKLVVHSLYMLFLSLLLCPLVLGQSSAERHHHIQPDDYFTLAGLSNCVPSHGGKLVGYLEWRWDEGRNGRYSELWTVDTQTRQRHRLTFDQSIATGPVWSPEDKHLYFSSNRGGENTSDSGKRQVWRIRADGSAMQQVTHSENDIQSFQLSRDGGTLYYTTAKKSGEGEWQDLRARFDGLEYGYGVDKFTVVRKVNLESWRSETIVDPDRVISDIAVSPNQDRIAMITRPDETLLSHEGWSRVDIYDTSTRKISTVTGDGWREGHPSPHGWLGSLSWSSDGKALAFTVAFDGYPAEIYTAEWPETGNGTAVSLYMLERPDGVTLESGSVEWHPQKRSLHFLGEKKARQHLYELTNVRNGNYKDAKNLTPGEVVIGGYSRSGSKLAVISGNTQVPEDIYLVGDSGKYDRLTVVNPQLDTWKLPQISIVSWAGEGGQTVEGILELPPDYDDKTPLPMIVQIHGGPTAAALFRLEFSSGGRGLFPSQGYALLSPNYRGSTGYGDPFMVDLIGRENDIDVKDILAGVDAMVEKGIADENRLGVMGWSNGGFLTNCLIAATNRFKAASSGAGVVDQVMQWGLEDTPGHVINYMRGLPWERSDAYKNASPLYDLNKVKTPTLIHVGQDDERVPAAHARTLYRALKSYLGVDTELVVYPGEPHGLRKYQHRKARIAWDLAWFDKYLN